MTNKTLSWSDEQTAIFNWFATGTGNLVVQARAGTGKTTTIKEAFSHAPETDILYAVFNKKNQVEAAAKITDERVDVRTLHSLGFMFIKRVWRDAKPNDDVEFDRIREVAPTLPFEVIGTVARLVGFCKNLTITVPDVQMVLDIIDDRDISVPDELEISFPPSKLAGIAIEALKRSLVKDAQGRISFNDMVWLPVAQGWAKPQFNLVVIDEAQDMNLPQLTMAERSCAKNGRICIVGDDRQAIYGFRGAVTNGMFMMKQRLNAATLGLTVTYRCPRAVVALAQTIVADYSAAPTAPEGEILDLGRDAALLRLEPGHAVLSRLNAPLMSVCLQLLRRGIAARIEGKDIAKQLVAQVRKFRAKSVPDFLRRLAHWGQKQGQRVVAAGGKNVETKLEAINDQVLTLAAVAEGCANVAEVERRITSLFEDSENCRKPAVVCSTVHKAKGLEWEAVTLLSETFRTTEGTGEEANIFYVAVTRAKNTLVRAL